MPVVSDIGNHGRQNLIVRHHVKNDTLPSNENIGSVAAIPSPSRVLTIFRKSIIACLIGKKALIGLMSGDCSPGELSDYWAQLGANSVADTFSSASDNSLRPPFQTQLALDLNLIVYYINLRIPSRR